MIVTKLVGKWESVSFVLNALDDSLFSVLETVEYEDSSYTLTKTVVVNIPESDLPKGFLRSHRYSHNKVEGTEVSYGVNIDTRKGLDIDINFAYSLHMSRKRSEAGKQLIRDEVTKEFGKVDFLKVSMEAIEGIMARTIADMNRSEEERVGRFFENSAADKADDLLVEAQNPEWQYLKMQEEQLKALLDSVRARQSVLRKEVLISELEKDKREFPDNIQTIINDVLINVDGIQKRRLFRC